ncbi:MAG TPA: chromosome segregation protein SMC [Bacteroidetes bacterium]|nr:chromosome segregation protein SMC [Bacteroidota bacterium]
MIKSIKLTNFFSFQDEEVILNQQTNILVGINGSGKSNLLKAIKLLKIGVEGNADDSALRELIVDRWGGFDNIYCKARSDGGFKNSIGIEFRLNGKILSRFGNGSITFRNDIIYKIILIKKPSTDNYYISEKISTISGYIYLDFINGSGKVRERQESGDIPPIKYDDYNPQELALSKISEFDKDRYLPLVTIKKAIRDIAVYTYFDTTPSSKLRRAMSATSGVKKLLPDGSNLPQILNSIKINHKDYYRVIQSKLKDVNEMFNGFDFNFLGSGVFELMLDENELNSSIHITHVSDGTLRYLCLLSILFNPDRGTFVCIDEPEVGLHPDMIYNISNSISEASEETTFLVVSHSENVLNGFNIDNIRVFEKDKSNSTKIKMFKEKDFEGWYEEFSPGSMWREGDLGGKRW